MSGNSVNISTKDDRNVCECFIVHFYIFVDICNLCLFCILKFHGIMSRLSYIRQAMIILARAPAGEINWPKRSKRPIFIYSGTSYYA